jgi:predicted ATPase/DNA-binding CsgD family transcriptional regulator
VEEPLQTWHPHLPAVLASFVGREREAREIRELLVTNRLLTLTGPGGVGKTRLALHVAEGLHAVYGDEIWLVEMAALDDPALLTGAVANVLGVTEQAGRPLLAILNEALRSRQLLLVLDNCEHLVEPCAALVEALLSACPSLHILATSRDGLGVVGERIWPVPSLTVPDPVEPWTVEQLGAYESVRLFVERAREAQPAFSLTTQNAPAVAEICRQLDGIPLAIELAAARSRVLAPHDLAARLDDRFRVLDGGRRTTSLRQQALRATVQWSYDLLTEPERLLLARLSVFAGGCTLHAVEAVCGDPSGMPRAAVGSVCLPAPDVLGVLARLVDQSLVVAEPGMEGSVRYRLLETIRQYAQERLEASGEAEEIRRRHAGLFLELTVPLAAGYGQPDMAARLAPTRAEHDNLRIALRWLVEAGEFDAAQQLGSRLIGLWNMTGRFSEGRARLDELLQLPVTDTHTETRARLLVGAGLLAWGQGDADVAQLHLTESLALCRELEDHFWTTHSLITLGIVSRTRGDARAARAYLEDAARLLPMVGSLTLGSNILYIQGLLAFDEGNYPTARTTATQALAAATQANFDRMIVRTLGLLGEVTSAERDFTAARAYLEQALAHARGHGDRWGEAGVLVPLARVALAQGDLAESIARLHEGFRCWRDLGNRSGISEAIQASAELAATLGDYHRAACLAGSATALREPGDSSPVGARNPAPWQAMVQAGLGEPAHAAAWAEGCALSIDEATALALELAGRVAAVHPVTPPSDPLTTREREVAALIARGLTNRQIAQGLVITEKTAANHVARVLAKLDLHSRAQLAARAADFGLLDAPSSI